jgi:hypothetical protein
MPATRSRTENWKNCLTQIADKGGSLEVAVKVDHLLNPGSDLIWRVRLLTVEDKEMVIEHPAFVGKSFKLSLNTELVAGMCVGQNRWMFGTRVIGARTVKLPSGRTVSGLVLAMPQRVERCSRREHFRVSTAEFMLPSVEVWPLSDPTTAIAAESANRQSIITAMNAVAAGQKVPPEGTVLLPEVGPKITGRLLNVSGGGLGLMFTPDVSGIVERSTYFWLRVLLRPHIPLPLGLTAKRAHSHMDAGQNLYAGLSFDFTFHQEHQVFVSELMGKYVDVVESIQRAARAKSAA